MTPELTLSGVEVSVISKSNVYSFGVLVYDWISNQLAFGNRKGAKHDTIPEHVRNAG
jgi:hypothetical protein